MIKTAVAAGIMSLTAQWVIRENSWYADAIPGRIVSEDGSPVADASVLVGWEAKRGAGRSYTLTLRTAEADVEGRFLVPAWSLFDWDFEFALVYAWQPQLFVAAPGYLPTRIVNATGMDAVVSRNSNVSMRALGSDIVLVKIGSRVTEAEKNDAMYLSSTAKMLGFDAKNCIWRTAPKFARRFAKIEKELEVNSPSFYGKELNSCSII